MYVLSCSSVSPEIIRYGLLDLKQSINQSVNRSKELWQQFFIIKCVMLKCAFDTLRKQIEQPATHRSIRKSEVETVRLCPKLCGNVSL